MRSWYLREKINLGPANGCIQFENAKILSNINCAIIVNKNKINNDEIIFFIDKILNEKNFIQKMKLEFEKIEIRNTNELMWNFIKNAK